jgi:pimeloyl-ACP methyl ester carboxylesterase
VTRRSSFGRSSFVGFAAALVLAFAIPRAVSADVWTDAKHGTVDSNGVKIHYATMGSGPVMVMIHGFPDFWYYVARPDGGAVEALSGGRESTSAGYNLSDKPAGQAQYDMSLLVGDVRAVVQQLAKGQKAVIVGHDWGGFVAWNFAMRHPELTERLIVLNLPHPRGVAYELTHNPEQQKNSAYARRFQEPDAAKTLTAEGLAKRVADAKEREHYIEAFKRSDFEAMLNYYKQKLPEGSVYRGHLPGRQGEGAGAVGTWPERHGPVAGMLNNTWQWLDNTLTLVTIPGVGHFVQNDAPDLVSSTMSSWLQLPLK